MLLKLDKNLIKFLVRGLHAVVCILALFSFKAYSFGLLTSTELPANGKLDFISKNFQTANQLFESTFGANEKNIKVILTDKDCFRTGYDYVKNQVVFCHKEEVIEMGTGSADVINHELFHAFLCNQKPELCKEALNVPVHEALADYFAYKLSPDECFGENFYKRRKCIRTYQTPNRIGYVEDAHTIGNVIVSDFISKDEPLNEILQMFSNYRPTDKVQENLAGRAKSKLNRYRLKTDEAFEIEFSFEDKDLIKLIQWQLPEGVTMIQKSPFKFSLQLAKEKEIATVIAFFYDRNGSEMGYRKYYLGHAL